MKYYKAILFSITFFTFIASCSKFGEIRPSNIVGFTVVNAVIGSNPILTDFTGINPVNNYYATTQKIGYGSFKEFSIISGSIPITSYQTTDTIHPVYKNTINLEEPVYSLFLCGQVTPTLLPDALLVADNLPYHLPTDSSLGVRFVNLSPGSNPVSVNLSGNSNGSEAASLPYKSITNFKNYPAVHTSSSIVFEFRDVTSGSLLGTYTMSGLNNASGTNTSTNSWRFRNFTIVLKGLPGVTTGANAQGTFLVNNY